MPWLGNKSEKNKKKVYRADGYHSSPILSISEQHKTTRRVFRRIGKEQEEGIYYNLEHSVDQTHLSAKSRRVTALRRSWRGTHQA
jgi:hypothetical protein